MRLLLFCFCIISCLSAEYSQKIASKAIQLSSAIYKISKRDQEANECPECYPQLKIVQQILGNEILGVVGVDSKLKNIVVAFRGSSNLQNFITDAQIIMKPYRGDSKCNGCQLHSGFYQSYQLLVDAGLLKAIKKAMRLYPTFGILFTGHSLGGAVAAISAVKLAQAQKNKNIQVYTFGQPRVGNQQYAEYTDHIIDKYFRIINQKDIVPHKPAYVISYRHSGHQIWYLNGMLSDYKGCKGDSNHCSNSLGNFNMHFSVQSHSTNNYLKLLFDRSPNKNIFETFKQNAKGKQLKKKLIELQNFALDWQFIPQFESDLFEMLADL